MIPASCPSDDTLIAHVHHELPAVESRTISSHLDGCQACRALLVAVVRGVAVGTPTSVAGAVTPLDVIGATRPEALPEGTMIGRYRVGPLLGVGGMGKVYAAHDTELDRAVALKVMRPELATIATELTDRLRRESQLIAKVVDPAVIAVYDIGRIDDTVFVAMERVRGETAREYLAHASPHWRVALDLYLRAGRGLAAAHKAGVIHRDFKPDNVLVELDRGAVSRVIVTDFGVARMIEESDGIRHSKPDLASVDLTATGVAVGTPAYMAPEQLDAKPALDARVDVFSFAATVWEALLGVRPFPGASVRAIRERMNAPPCIEGARSVPAWVVRALRRGLAIDPAARWPNMPSLLTTLDRRRRFRRRFNLARVVAAALVGVGVVTFALTRSAAPDACDRLRSDFETALGADREAQVRAALASDPMTAGAFATKIDGWRTVAATCRADQLATTTCLDARRTELAGFAAEVAGAGSDASRRANALAATVVDPVRCKSAPPGLLQARAPSDPITRTAVADIRVKLADAVGQRDRGDVTAATHSLEALTANKVAWDPLRAELVYELGATQHAAGDVVTAIATLREAEAIAVSASPRDDLIAAQIWTELAITTVEREDGAHGVEYVALADAALDRVGRPVDIDARLASARAAAYDATDRRPDAEAAARHAIELAEAGARVELPRALGMLAQVMEREGNYADAATTYRRGLDALPAGHTQVVAEVKLRRELGLALARSGHPEPALSEVGAAVALADARLSAGPVRALAHSSLSVAEQFAGDSARALGEAEQADAMIVKYGGERTLDWAGVADIEGRLLQDLSRDAEAEAKLERACDVAAFVLAASSTDLASCWLDLAQSRHDRGKNREALDLISRALAIDEARMGPDHTDVADLYQLRGNIEFTMHQRAETIADLEHASVNIEKALAGAKSVGSGALGAVEW